MKTLLIVAMLVVLPMHAEARFYDGNALVELMRISELPESEVTDTDIFQVGIFSGYIAGAVDAWHMNGEFCPTGAFTQGHAEAIVSAYLKTHPTEWHLEAALLVRAALIEAFPCG